MLNQLSEEEQYVAVMSQFRLRLMDGIASNHIMLDEAMVKGISPALRARRVARELASCEVCEAALLANP